MGDDGPAVQHLGEFAGDLLEAGSSGEPFARQPVHVDRAGVATRVDERRVLPLDAAVLPQHQRGHAEHPMRVGAQAGGLDVDDHPAVALRQRPRTRRVRQRVDHLHLLYLRLFSGRSHRRTGT